VAQVDAKHALVGVHQGQGIELKPALAPSSADHLRTHWAAHLHLERFALGTQKSGAKILVGFYRPWNIGARFSTKARAASR
jgi:hypothetical protein